MNPMIPGFLTLLLLIAGVPPSPAPAQDAPRKAAPVSPGDRIVLVGNTLAERMSLFPHFEAELTELMAGDSLTFRNLGWSGDEVALRPRPLNFGNLHTHLTEQQADVVLAFFGFNESFGGREGIPSFRADLTSLLEELNSRRYNGTTPPRVVLVSPIAQERVDHVPLDPARHNRNIALYTEAMRDVAARLEVGFIDLFTPTLALASDPELGDLTINGIHLDDRGYQLVSRLLLEGLGLKAQAADTRELTPCGKAERAEERLALEEAIRRKNDLFFYRWRAVNGEYIYGRRKEPFGVENFPKEMRQLEEMIQAKEREIWALAQAAHEALHAGNARGCALLHTR